MIFSIFGNKNINALSDESLMIQASRGKNEAFNELYNRYGDKLYRYFARLLNNEVLAEDFTQDLFIKIMVSANTFHPQKKFTTWMYTIASNMCRNEWRNRSNRALILNQIKTDEEFNHHHHEHLDKRSLQHKLELEIQKFEEDDQLIINMRYEQELSIQEISQILDIPEGTVKSRLFYLMKKLNLKLKAYSPY